MASETAVAAGVLARNAIDARILAAMTGRQGSGAMNTKIEQAREVALGILKPSQRDLEYGLGLHREAVVIDGYGFSPRAAIDGEALRALVEEGASEAEITDSIEEMTMTRAATDPVQREEYLAAWNAAGVTCIVQNAGEEGQSPQRLLKRLARFTYTTDCLRGTVSRAAFPDDILRTKEAGAHCLYFTGNGVPLAQEWVSPEEELRFVRLFFQLGIRMMHLTYNRRNMIGDGCAERANGGLSDFGHAVIAEMNRVGVIVDVAHSGWQTSLEAAKASRVPMVASHSGCCAVNTHIRCKPDEVIRAIVETGGYIGICWVPAFLGGSGDISALLDHVEYVARTFGADYVALGSDTAYTAAAYEDEWKKVPPRRRSRPRWEGFWPKDDPLFDSTWHQPHQVQSLAWTNWPLITVGLVQRGFSDEEIRKILGGNVLRVARAVLDAAGVATS
ncbi:MAG TPA: membrane dipeptidase [Armatimonadota bacterium]|nr:membrane dipeptidase [Armatimonadota bacterium]